MSIESVIEADSDAVDQSWTYAQLSAGWNAEQVAYSDHFFWRACHEIEKDIEQGLLPEWIGDFDDLKRVSEEAYDYGGLRTPVHENRLMALFGPLCTPVVGVNSARDIMRQRLHEWLRGRPNAIPYARFRRDFDQMRKACENRRLKIALDADLVTMKESAHWAAAHGVRCIAEETELFNEASARIIERLDCGVHAALVKNDHERLIDVLEAEIQSWWQAVNAPLVRERSRWQCTSCARIYGWHQMLARNGIRNNCPSCLPQRCLVGTMDRLAE